MQLDMVYPDGSVPGMFVLRILLQWPFLKKLFTIILLKEIRMSINARNNSSEFI